MKFDRQSLNPTEERKSQEDKHSLTWPYLIYAPVFCVKQGTILHSLVLVWVRVRELRHRLAWQAKTIRGYITSKEGISFRVIITFRNSVLCSSQKYPYSPHRRDWKFQGGWEISKVQKFQAMYEAKLEFPEGEGVIGQIPSVGGCGYFYVLCFTTGPLSGSEARVDFVLIHSSLLFICKSQCPHANKFLIITIDK